MNTKPKPGQWKKKGQKYCARCSSDWDKHWETCQRCGHTESKEA